MRRVLLLALALTLGGAALSPVLEILNTPNGVHEKAAYHKHGISPEKAKQKLSPAAKVLDLRFYDVMARGFWDLFSEHPAHAGSFWNFIGGSAAYSNTKSLLFDASNELLDCGNLTMQAQQSLCFWVKPSSLVSNLSIAAKWSASTNERSFVCQSQDADNTKIQCLFSGSGSAVQKNYRGNQVLQSTSAWHQFCVTMNGDTIKFYGDGTEDTGITKVADTSLTGGQVLSSSVEFYIGALRRNGAGNIAAWYGGRIDEVSWWTAELNSTAISATRSGSTPANLTGQSNLAHWWRMGDSPDSISASGIADRVGSLHCSPSNMESGDIDSDVPS